MRIKSIYPSMTYPCHAAMSTGTYPDKAPRPPFIACGQNIKKRVVIRHGNLVDGAPTYAEILGVKLPNADGTPFYEIIGE